MKFQVFHDLPSSVYLHDEMEKSVASGLPVNWLFICWMRQTQTTWTARDCIDWVSCFLRRQKADPPKIVFSQIITLPSSSLNLRLGTAWRREGDEAMKTTIISFFEGKWTQEPWERNWAGQENEGEAKKVFKNIFLEEEGDLLCKSLEEHERRQAFLATRVVTQSSNFTNFCCCRSSFSQKKLSKVPLFNSQSIATLLHFTSFESCWPSCVKTPDSGVSSLHLFHSYFPHLNLL